MKGISKRECFLTDMSHLPVSRALMSILASLDSALLRTKVGDLWRPRSKKGPFDWDQEIGSSNLPTPTSLLLPRSVASLGSHCYTIPRHVPKLTRRGPKVCLATRSSR